MRPDPDQSVVKRDDMRPDPDQSVVKRDDVRSDPPECGFWAGLVLLKQISFFEPTKEKGKDKRVKFTVTRTQSSPTMCSFYLFSFDSGPKRN